MKKKRTTQKSIKDKLDAELKSADDIIADFENPTDSELIEIDNRIVNTRRERGLAPRTEVLSDPDSGDLGVDYQYA